MSDPTRRFSSRVENYVRHRPGYPRELVGLLVEECGLSADSVVADLGSGPGNLSELFLRHGCRVYGVEPNREMREAGERSMEGYANFESVAGSAEATTLGAGSVDFVVAGQAFHWFEPDAARREFARILKDDGWAVVVWNDRRTDGSAFLEAYESLLLKRGTDYREVSHKYADERVLRPFFDARGMRLEVFENEQSFDFEGLKGRLLSSSYTPEPGHPNYTPMLEELAALFDAHAADGRIAFEYETKVYYGQIRRG
ncbi:MAG: class I SAM-dependent methyltransferase [Acidobacteria bacterium]|nr:class I SAM-dependent methyltransferase [Acidobacteriota bacterium]